jgi:hypothetical protein
MDLTTPVSVDDEVAKEFAALGVKVEPKGQSEEAIPVWAANWPALTTFLAVETQWRVAVGMGGMIRLGIDYTALDVVLRRLKADDTIFEDIQVMEREALTTFAEAD